MRSKLYYELIKRLILLIERIKSLMEISLLNLDKHTAFRSENVVA